MLFLIITVKFAASRRTGVLDLVGLKKNKLILIDIDMMCNYV